MSNFWQRAITGIVFVALVVFLTFNRYSFIGLLMTIGGIGLWEYYRIVFSNQLKGIHYAYILLGIAIILSPIFNVWYLLMVPALFGITAILVLFSEDRKWSVIGHLFSSIFYIPVPLAMFYFSVYGIDHRIADLGSDCGTKSYDLSPLLPLNLFILIWSSDTFAYLSGRAFGKTKLFEAVSPKKTWEGLIGGSILTMVFSYFLAKWIGIPVYINVLIAFLTVVFGTLGDLVESMLKREYGVKDSGSILPGHGGVLDRFDALLVSLPFTTLLYFWMSQN